MTQLLYAVANVAVPFLSKESILKEETQQAVDVKDLKVSVQ